MLKEKNANKYIYSNYFGFWNPLKSEPPYSVGDLELYDNIFQIWVIYFLFFFFFSLFFRKRATADCWKDLCLVHSYIFEGSLVGWAVGKSVDVPHKHLSGGVAGLC